MKKYLRLLWSAALFACCTTIASATTVSGTVEEGGPANDYNGLEANFSFGDFSDSVANPVLTVGGDLVLWGSVYNQNGTRFKDGWTMDFGSSVWNVSLDFQVLDGPVDILVQVQGLDPFAIVAPEGAAGSTPSAKFTGVVTFLIDPTFGSENPEETITYQLNVAQVPLPAGLILLLTGLGGFVLTRSRKGMAA